jgi:prolyl-tRNA synthetase
LDAISERVAPLVKELRSKGISVKYDDRDTQKPGFKFNEYELKGVPVRLAIGQRDMDNGTYEVARRDTFEKETVKGDEVVAKIEFLLEDIQANIYNKALEHRRTHITEVNSYEEFKEVLENKGGFLSAHWDGTPETEELVKEQTKATIRCIPIDAKEQAGVCMVTGKPSTKRVLFAKAY